MRIGLISDTHIPTMGAAPPAQVALAFEGVELILHAGNIYRPDVLDWLEGIAPVKAAGSSDGERPEHPQGFSMECQGDPRVAPQQVMQAEGHTIGVVNNLLLRGMNDDVGPGVIGAHLRRRPDLSFPGMVERFFGALVDIVVFGRTNFAMVEEHQGVLFINPGSPSLPRNLRKLGSVAVLDLWPEGAEVRIVDLASLGE
jgi:putative phosphoesterase